MFHIRFSLLFPIVISISRAAYAQPDAGSWHTLPNAPVASDNGRFDDVFFINPTTGWITNVGEGKIYQTTDGGHSWVEQVDAQRVFGYHVGFRCVGFANDRVGWTGNLNFHNNPIPKRSLFETKDGGETWTNISNRISGPDPAGICGLWVVNEQIIYGAGRWNGPPIFIKSVDGGNSWTSMDLRPLTTGLVDVFFFNADAGLIVGGNGDGSSIEEQKASKAVILFTPDGGKTWQTVYESQTLGKRCWKISFPTRHIGYVATQGANNDGIILKTTDGGLTWEERFAGAGLSFSGIGFVTSQRGWVGELGTYETLDGGNGWQEVKNVGRKINRFRMLSDTLGYAVGETVYKFSRSLPVAVSDNKFELPTELALAQNYPNPFNPSTTITYSINLSSPIELAVFNVNGQVVATLVNEYKTAGIYRVPFEGAELPSGVYFYKLRAGSLVATKKMILIR